MRDLFESLSTATPGVGVAVSSLVQSFYTSATEAEARRFDLALWKMLKSAAPALRAAVADGLSCLENGPSLTLRALACDPDPEVALPVLRNSRALCDCALAEIARCKGPDHLNAIAERSGLDQKITAILIRRGTRRVLETLSMNQSARFSAAGARRLGKRLRGYAGIGRAPSAWTSDTPRALL